MKINLLFSDEEFLKIMPPVVDMKMPLKSIEIDAMAFRPIRSCRKINKIQAGKIVAELIVNIMKGEIPSP